MLAVVDIRAQFATWTWQRIEERFARNPGGEPGSRAWLAVAGRGQDARTARPDGEEPECRTPEQMKMANAFCRYLELAERSP
jgi:hypothetical protein